MGSSLLRLARSGGGVVTRAEALTVVRSHIIDDAIKAGSVLRVFPGVYVLPERLRERWVQRLAALAYCRGGALSHTDALDVWGLPAPGASSAVHVTVPAGHPAVRDKRIVLHRRRDFALGPPQTRIYDGFPVVTIEQAIIESWPLLPLMDRRAPAIVAIRERRVSAQGLLAMLTQQPRTAGAAQLRELFALVGGGCHSELELWGHERVFNDPRLPRSVRQHPIPLAGKTIYLDRYFEEEMVDVELDGAAYHGSPGQRERDLRRDAQLAALGIQVVRYSHPRLHAASSGVIDEMLAIVAMRRRQLGRRV